jgi:hypothetical protein
MVANSGEIHSSTELDGLGELERESVLRRFYTRFRTQLGFGSAAVLVLVGWLLRDRHYLSADEGLGYALGILSACCIVVLLMYPFRKRLRILRFLGPIRDWFRVHMMMGITATVIALYHCNFQLGSLNSRIALFSALVIAGSGIIGRYIYTKIHHGLYGRRANLRELLAQVKLTSPRGVRVGTFVPELKQRIIAFDRHVMVPPRGLWESIKLPFHLAWVTRLEYWRLMRFTRYRIIAESTVSPAVAQHRERLIQATQQYISMHLSKVRRVAEFNAYERLFALWHAVHLPFFYIFLVSVVVHVVVVHIY